MKKKRKPTKLEIKYNFDYDLIIRLYTNNKLYIRPDKLTDYLELRGEKKYPHYEIRKGRQVIVYDKSKSKRK